METKESAQENTPRLKLSIRGKGGISSYWGPPNVSKDPALSNPNATVLQYSHDGDLLAVAEPANGIIWIQDSETGEVLQKIENAGRVHVMAFSPKGTYLLTWERLTKEKTQDNMLIWEVKTGECKAKLLQKAYAPETWPSIKWTSDEAACGRMVSTEVQFFENLDFKNVARRLKLPDIARYELSPGNDTKIAAFVPEKKGAPAFVRLFKYPSMEMISSKSFFKAQDVDLTWNSTGTSLLVCTHTDVDKSGKSYYGETGLHFLSADGKFDANVVLKKEGPIHDCCWNPNGKEFAVTYGFMPPQTTIFDLKCQPIVDLGENSRNTLRYSPNGQLLCVGGFGNLTGTMDMWDVKKVKKVGTAVADCAAHCEWSPDSRHILTAVLSPRVRVDNGFTIWKYDGTQLYYEPVDELYQVCWRPTPFRKFPNRPLSPSVYAAAKAAVEEKKQAAKYVHPNSRLSSGLNPLKHEEHGPVKYKRDQQKPPENLPPGFVPDESKNAKKNKKRRAKKKGDHATGEDGTPEDDHEQDQAPSKPPVPTTSEQPKQSGEQKPAPTKQSNEQKAPPQTKQPNEQKPQAQPKQPNEQKPQAPPKQPNEQKAQAQPKPSGQRQPTPTKQPEPKPQDPETLKKIKTLTKKLRQIEELKEQQKSGKTLDKAQLDKINGEKQIRTELKSLS